MIDMAEKTVTNKDKFMKDIIKAIDEKSVMKAIQSGEVDCYNNTEILNWILKKKFKNEKIKVDSLLPILKIFSIRKRRGYCHLKIIQPEDKEVDDMIRELEKESIQEKDENY